MATCQFCRSSLSTNFLSKKTYRWVKLLVQRCVAPFINYAILIYVEQKDHENQWKVAVLEEFTA